MNNHSFNSTMSPRMLKAAKERASKNISISCSPNSCKEAGVDT